MPPVVGAFLRFLQRRPPRQGEDRQLLCNFHCWIQEQQIRPARLRPSHVGQYMRMPWAEALADSTWTKYRRQLERFVRWCTQGACHADAPGHDDQHHSPPQQWTASVRHFIESLEPALKASTCRSYELELRYLLKWASSTGVDPAVMTRADGLAFCRSLYERGLSPATRGRTIIVVRSYMRYLAIHGQMHTDPDSVILPSDIPRVPKRLPRALPHDVDTELQQRLADALKPLWRALLLMRKTGIRVGELRTLGYDCLRVDGNGNSYLKVPLGKLNTERLVPLDHQSVDLVKYLQQLQTQPRRWLLQNPSGSPCHRDTYARALERATYGLRQQSDAKRITTHQLRHTFATSLLNAGMSLPSLQRLLGHRSIHMTLHYATLQLDTVTEEYFNALEAMKTRYECPSVLAGQTLANTAPSDRVAEMAVEVQREAGERPEGTRAQTLRLARRLNHISARLKELGL